MSEGVGADEKNNATIENRQVSHDPEHGLLLGTYHVRGADKFCGTSKLRLNASGSHLCRSFTTPHERPCIGIHSGTRFEGQRFACKHGLVQ